MWAQLMSLVPEDMLNLTTGFKLLQIVPMGVMGLVMATDVVHGQISREFVGKLGYPSWFAPALGSVLLRKTCREL